MSRIFLTGSGDGLGRAAAEALLDEGHAVVVDARTGGRLEAVKDHLDRARRPSWATSPSSMRARSSGAGEGNRIR
ncbi:SDR family NAD(P)-dependent oxidoreductase [Pseudarthrobacter raffinosi]|uniref:SDR family NAD(P)-dependent oxidoreductase n=1 Tax=Pseudarthrobacter raffinosi TaxID=2953651 RepID=UPI0027E21C57|nr:SDR family NAD(P)-dependent oxidoreductase [Pseudarthrobacter sp. MDT3-28]